MSLHGQVTSLLFVFPLAPFLRIYEQLPEVQRKREEEKRRLEYKSYRLRAQLFKKVSQSLSSIHQVYQGKEKLRETHLTCLN